MTINDNLNKNDKDRLFKLSFIKGAVFINKFENIDHPKFFIIVGLSKDKIFTCSVYINSNIPKAIMKRQALLDLQVPVKGTKYSFLNHDSFVCCSTPLLIETVTIQKWIASKTCFFKGQLDKEDLENVTTTMIQSGLLSDEELELYFS
ncbi:MAG: hypothetical protein PHT07_05900 [Paludibacter sp.]|nr:hypothetical protein [Paludibacter sp.]